MADNYKDTLNLPKTDFPMKANLPNREPNMLAFWEDLNLYQQIQENGADRPVFILHDGPPYANGNTHIGHAVNKTLKDIVVKSKAMSGFRAPYVPGWDCHGLPVELNVEKKIGKAGVKVSKQDFRRACRDYAGSQVDIQRGEFKRLGIIGDWEKPYLTMTHDYEANVIRSLARIVQNGHLTHGRKPVHWCVDCGSALAEAEVEYQDKMSPAIYVRFSVTDPQDLAKRFNVTELPGEVSIPIWTTTPWTLPANQAIAVNPGHLYSLAKVNDEFIVVASDLLDSVITNLENPPYEVLAQMEGEGLENVQCQHPFYDRASQVILADHVTLDAGTGNVHTAPAHGQDDYVVCSRYGLPVDNPVDNRGCFKDDVAFFAGSHVFKANEPIIEKLKEQGKLLHREDISHSYPHCWRHKTPLIFRATPQWFISMDQNGLRSKALDAIKTSEWIPDWGQARIAEMIFKRPDWCISRQRVWGTPITLIVHKDTYELHPKTNEIMEQVAKRVAQEGLEVWDDIKLEDLIDEVDDYQKVTDTLDVWFDSGVSHVSVLEQNDSLRSPAELYLEGSDQHRGWFQTSLLSSVAIHGRAPFKQVLTHGFTVDSDGHKMSKSLGNVIAPEQVIKKMGADPLRLWVAETDYRAEISISDEILKRTSDAYRRIRNTARFLLSNLNDFDYAKDAVPQDQMLELDQWAVDFVAHLQDEIKGLYDSYQFHLIVKKIHRFCTVEMGGFYLDVIKDRLYTSQKNGLSRRSAQTAMHHILEAFVRWLAPILSFTSEEIWQNMAGERAKSIFMTTWYEDLFTVDDVLRMRWQRIMQARDAVNKALEDARNNDVIGSGLAADVTLFCDDVVYDFLNSIGDELRFVLITSTAKLKKMSEKSDDAVDTDVSGLALSVSASVHEKCARCWHRLPDVNADSDYPHLCKRCVTNVAGDGEERRYA